jgi:heme/copper-type cytochrome/quinol oxidase subunit 2
MKKVKNQVNTDQQGFITMIIMIVIAIVVVFALAYLRVKGANK